MARTVANSGQQLSCVYSPSYLHGQSNKLFAYMVVLHQYGKVKHSEMRTTRNTIGPLVRDVNGRFHAFLRE